MKVISVIPARIGSTRLPEKPLREIKGKSLIQRVYEQVKKCGLIDDIIVATDDKRIYDHIESFGGKAMMTSENHQSGTDRVAEVASKVECDVIVNVQGDEPFMRSDMIKKSISPFVEENFHGISTLKTKIVKDEDIENPNIVKVVADHKDNALYFSRASIPYNRDNDIEFDYFKHIGLYVYDKETLKKITEMKQEELENIEKLEQLRALYNGIKIKVLEVDYNGIEINTPEDLEKAVEFLDN